PWVVSGDATLRVSRRPNHAVIVFRHAHRHLRDGLADESERSLSWVKLNEVAAEVGVKAIVAGKDGSERRIATVRERRRKLFAFARLSVNEQQSVATTMVVEPDQDDVALLPILGGDDAPMGAEGRRDTVIGEQTINGTCRRPATIRHRHHCEEPEPTCQITHAHHPANH
ncbi:MAG: hypothetical protein PVTTEEND_001375, partial [Candidatus Fervidibacter sp.]